MSTPDPLLPEDLGAPAGTVCFRFANAEFDERRHELRVAGLPAKLEPLGRRLLLELLQHTNEVMTKEDLLDLVWGRHVEVQEQALISAVSKLRVALGKEASARLVTVPRIGYRLDGPVQRLESAARHLVLQAGHAVPARPGWVLERALGSGGHADVWLGRHQKLGHARVFKFAADGNRLSALRREFTLNRLLAQALGPRPDFTSVIDAQLNTEPFFLECVYGGRDLLDWSAQPEAPLATMPLDQRLALFATLAQAVADAHGVGVLHKDLKPGNVLIERRAPPGETPAPSAAIEGASPATPIVDGAATSASNDPIEADTGAPAPAGQSQAWQLRLTDFGSGRLLDRSVLQALNLTALGLSHTVDAKDSTISGTLMYLAPELLAGHAASVQSDVYSLGVMLYQWVVGDLRRPLATGWERDIANPLLRADIACATEGDSKTRLATAAELAHLLLTMEQRQAAVEAEAQAKAQLARQAEELARTRARRPWVAVAFAALLAGLAFSLWQYHQATQARRQAEGALKSSQATLDFLTEDVLTTTDVTSSSATRPKPLLELARQGARRVAERFAGLPEQELAARQHLARTFGKLRAITDAENQYEAALALLKARVAPDDERLLHLQLEYAAMLLEHGVSGSDRFPTGQRLAQEATRMAGQQRLAGGDPLALLAARVRVNSLLAEGRDSAAVEAGHALLARTERAGTRPGASMADRIEARRVLAHTLMISGQLAESDQVLSALTRPPLNAEAQSLSAWTQVRMMRAAVLRDQGAYAAAEPMLHDVLRRLSQQAQPNLFQLGYAHAELGSLLRQAHQPARAAAEFQAALNAFRAVLGEDHPFALTTALNLGYEWLALNRNDEALAVCRDTEAAIKETMAGGRSNLRDWLCARAWMSAGQPEHAMPYLNALPTPGPNDLPEGVGTRAWQFQAMKGLALERLGQAEVGQRLMLQARQMLSRHGNLPVGITVVDARFAQMK